MTPKQTRFIAEYLANGLNATEAAKSAGYSARTAESQGSRMLRNVEVAAEIAKRAEKVISKLEITTEKVLAELAHIGFANMLDYMQVAKDGHSFDLDMSKLTREQAAAIQEVTIDATGGEWGWRTPQSPSHPVGIERFAANSGETVMRLLTDECSPLR